MSQHTDPEESRRPWNPLLIWRWGFTLVLVAGGTWLVIYGPQFADVQGRTLGWVVIGYAVVRFVLGQLSGSPRKGHKPLARHVQDGESA